MKTKTWILLLVLLLIVCVGFSIPLLLPGEDAAYAKIHSQGQLIRTVDLKIDQEFTVELEGGSNTVTVAGGRIAVTQANCPDSYCMKRGFCQGGAQIVCLPNRLVIKFVGNSEVDGVVG